ncbi:hypothetical protein CPC16_003211, partial [Podila verticillata]
MGRVNRPDKDVFAPGIEKMIMVPQGSEAELAKTARNFRQIDRISFDIGDDVLLATVNRVVVTEGLPIVIFGYDKHVNWDKDMFSEE